MLGETEKYAGRFFELTSSSLRYVMGDGETMRRNARADPKHFLLFFALSVAIYVICNATLTGFSESTLALSLPFAVAAAIQLFHGTTTVAISALIWRRYDGLNFPMGITALSSGVAIVLSALPLLILFGIEEFRYALVVFIGIPCCSDPLWLTILIRGMKLLLYVLVFLAVLGLLRAYLTALWVEYGVGRRIAFTSLLFVIGVFIYPFFLGATLLAMSALPILDPAVYADLLYLFW